MKSKCCNKPLRLSRENPEPGETMYYICDGCNQPADPKCDHGDHIMCNECTELEEGKHSSSVHPVCPVCGTLSSWGMMHRCKKGLLALHDGTDYKDFCVDVKPAGDVAQVHLDQAQLHADDYVDKNYPDEREVSKLKEASMQNKPRIDFDAHRFDIILSVDAGLKRIFDERLATALEDQRATFVDEVKNRKATIKWLWGKQKTDDECFLMVMEQVQKIADILNGKE